MKTLIAIVLAAGALALSGAAAAQPYGHDDRGGGYDRGHHGEGRWRRHHREQVCHLRHHHRVCYWR